MSNYLRKLFLTFWIFPWGLGGRVGPPNGSFHPSQWVQPWQPEEINQWGHWNVCGHAGVEECHWELGACPSPSWSYFKASEAAIICRSVLHQILNPLSLVLLCIWPWPLTSLQRKVSERKQSIEYHIKKKMRVGCFFMEMKHFSGEIPFRLPPVGQGSK